MLRPHEVQYMTYEYAYVFIREFITRYTVWLPYPVQYINIDVCFRC